MDFEWNDAKAESNAEKHGVSFAEAMTIFCRHAVKTMKMATSPNPPVADDDLQPEYNFRSMRGVVRGKYAARYRERLRMVRLAADVSAAFADEAAVNAALREYLRSHQEHQTINPSQSTAG